MGVLPQHFLSKLSEAEGRVKLVNCIVTDLLKPLASLRLKNLYRNVSKTSKEKRAQSSPLEVATIFIKKNGLIFFVSSFNNAFT